LSRERQLRADAIAVRLTRDPVGLSEALHKVSSGWRGIGYIPRDLGSLFIINPAVDARDEKEDSWANLQSTHPPIRKRIKILADMAHLGVKDIEANVRKETERRNSMREMPRATEEPVWTFADEKGAWQGPFTLGQAMVLGWLTPDTLVRHAGGQDPVRAKDEPLLAPVLDSKIRGSRVSDLQCPSCKQNLVEEEYEGAPIQRCAFCDGVLIKWRQLPRIGLRTEKGFDERIKKLAEYAEKDKDARRRDSKNRGTSPLKCPKCARGMYRGDYSEAYPVEVDKCLACSLVWFDKDELEMFQYMLETKGVTPDGWD
jgi:Zn-finger nucleic acid-binding protein